MVFDVITNNNYDVTEMSIINDVIIVTSQPHHNSIEFLDTAREIHAPFGPERGFNLGTGQGQTRNDITLLQTATSGREINRTVINLVHNGSLDLLIFGLGHGFEPNNWHGIKSVKVIGLCRGKGRSGEIPFGVVDPQTRDVDAFFRWRIGDDGLGEEL